MRLSEIQLEDLKFSGPKLGGCEDVQRAEVVRGPHTGQAVYVKTPAADGSANALGHKQNILLTALMGELSRVFAPDVTPQHFVVKRDDQVIGSASVEMKELTLFGDGDPLSVQNAKKHLLNDIRGAAIKLVWKYFILDGDIHSGNLGNYLFDFDQTLFPFRECADPQDALYQMYPLTKDVLEWFPGVTDVCFDGQGYSNFDNARVNVDYSQGLNPPGALTNWVRLFASLSEDAQDGDTSLSEFKAAVTAAFEQIASLDLSTLAAEMQLAGLDGDLAIRATSFLMDRQVAVRKMLQEVAAQQASPPGKRSRDQLVSSGELGRPKPKSPKKDKDAVSPGRRQAQVARTAGIVPQALFGAPVTSRADAGAASTSLPSSPSKLPFDRCAIDAVSPPVSPRLSKVGAGSGK